MKNTIRFSLFAILLLILAACQVGPSGDPVQTLSPENSTQESASAAENGDAAYPYPQRTRLPERTPRSYPEPGNGDAQSYEVEFVAPEPDDENGVVIGQVLDIDTGEPMAFTPIYLGIKIPLEPRGYTYALQEKSSPHTVTNHEGKFGIGNVPPGSYLLMIFTPHGMTVVFEPNSDQELEVLVEAGKTLDLGTQEGPMPRP